LGDIVIKVINSILNFLERENDSRGYKDEKGLVYSIAHLPNMLVSALRHPYFRLEFSEKSLGAIRVCLFKKASYIDDNERLMYIVAAIVKKLDEVTLIYFINGLNNA